MSQDSHRERHDASGKEEMSSGWFERWQERQQKARRSSDPRHHTKLASDSSDFIRRVRVRLGGFDVQGNPIDYAEDIQKFQEVESEFVEWARDMKAAAENDQSPRDEIGMTPGMRAAAARYNREGGHPFQLDEDHVEDMLRRGAIVFLEVETRKKTREILGTVSALSRSVKSDEESYPEDVSELDPTWPQYDLRDILGMPHEKRKNFLRGYKKRLLIVRSSIRKSLEHIDSDLLSESDRARPLRRLGLGARGKDELFHIARMFGSESLTFNIGSVGTPSRPDLYYHNEPSEKHNVWMKPLYYRTYFASRLVDAIKVYYKAYEGSIEEGIDEFERPNGILTGKGWDQQTIHASAAFWQLQLQKDIERGRHEPW